MSQEDRARRKAQLLAAYEQEILDDDTYQAALAALDEPATPQTNLEESTAATGHNPVAAILGTAYQAETDSSVVAQGAGTTAVAPGGVNVGGSVQGSIITGNVYQGPETADPEAALRIYRQVLLRISETLPLRGVDIGASDAAGNQPLLGLANVYVDLDTTSKAHHLRAESGEYHLRLAGESGFGESADAQGEETTTRLLQKEREGEPEPIPALQKVVENKWLVLTGDPGSGKSTFVNHLAHCLAAHALTPQANWLQQLHGWPAVEADLLPVVVILRDFAAALPESLPEKAMANHLWRFINNRLAAQNLAFAAEPLRQALEKGRALLLLDGLDEVPTTVERIFVRDAVMAFARRYPGNRYLVTCRVLSYQPPEREDEPDLRLPASSFPSFELAPFDEAKIDRFIYAWYAELVRTGAVRDQDRVELAQRLKTAVRRPDLWRLAPNPLLLTVMALVHTHQGRLPDSRALLYENTVDMLLWRWEEVKAGGQKDALSLRQLLLDAGRSEMDLKRLLWRLAYDAHGQTEADVGAEALADIGESQLTRALEGLKRGDWTRAHQIVMAMKLRAGLLLERAPGVFTFPHRTFQEYLAGAYLSTLGDFSEQATALAAEGPLWREVILLAVGRLAHLAGDTDRPYALVNRLCPTTEIDDEVAWKNAWLAGDVLLEMGLPRVQDDDWGQELLDRVRWRLAHLVAKGRLAPRERIEAGDTLGQLGDPRPGVCTLEPALIPIPAGPFLMGEEKVEITIETPYAIGRLPVTNAQFQMFVDDGGYTGKWRHCWTEAGWKEREEGNWMRPRLWQDEQFNQPNQPVVAVTWYEAVAYANWLAQTTGKPYRLPTEAEWERAARHTDGRTYPWGDGWQDGIANTKEAGLQRPAAVGAFPGDVAESGAQDMAGNVSEWCQTRWRDEQGKDYSLPYRFDDNREALSGGNEARRVLRGGSYLDDQTRWPRCAYRFRLIPRYRLHYIGFRLMLSPFLSLDSDAAGPLNL